ncbi:MAG: NAD-dependent epimerase [Marivirga sp.]|nr:NAD-dependent epimerase [Marivirga sp.]
MKNSFEKKNVLITGGLGFLGSNLALRLMEFGANVTVIDNLAPLYGGNIFNIREGADKVKVIINDIRNIEIIKPLIEAADLIFHLAAQVSYIDSLNIPHEDLDLNAKATLNILECCRKYNPKTKILFSSSRMIYGKVEQPIVREDSPTNPLSLYGIHKLTSEKYLLMYYKDFGIPTTVLRITNPYGPHQQIKHSKYSLVGWFIRQAMEGQTIKIFGDGVQLRDYIFVDDIVNAMIKCAEAPGAVGEVINLGSGNSSRFCDMVSTVINTVGNGRMEFIPWPNNYEKIETGDVSVDISKLKSITSWQPVHSLDEGIRKTYEYYKKYSDKYI